MGDRVDSIKAGRTIRTRWVTQGPIRNASFNLGLFGNYTVNKSGAPPVTVMMSEEARRKFGRVQQSKMRETVGEDVSKSLLFFQNMYGPAPALHFYATETPTFDGEASEIDLPLMPAEPRSVRFNDLDGVLAEVKTVEWRD